LHLAGVTSLTDPGDVSWNSHDSPSLPSCHRRGGPLGNGVSNARAPATLCASDPDGHRVGLSVHRFEARRP
jgi:hypothetical protein